jgi:LPS sulfotransferase NodH
MAEEPIVCVCGFGRCGSTLVMSMLDAGGFPVVSTTKWAYEHPEAERDPLRREWLEKCRGRAIKLLDPHLHALPPGLSYCFVWLDRNVREQVKSALKWRSKIMKRPIFGGMARGLRKGLERDRSKAIRALEAHGTPILELRFEELLAEPARSAARLANHVGRDLDLEAMAGRVVARSAKCLSYLLELTKPDALKRS